MTMERDAELSALLDGALGEREEALLRAELSRDPALAARLAELAQVDAELRALPVRPVPMDLRARLQARLDAEANERPQLMALRGGAPARTGRRRMWLAGFAAAAAAAVVAFVGVPGLDGGDPARDVVAVDSTPRRDVAPAPGPEPSRVPESRGPEAVAAIPAPQTSPEPGTSAPTEVDLEAPEPSRIAVAPVREAAQTELAPAREQVVALEGDPIALARDTAAPTSEPRSAPQLATTAEPALLVEVSDDEAQALDELELRDTGVVAVLDLLGELDALEAGAS